nr:fimbria/pilus outer membrane usher protein [Pectobacterium colocasium]
MKKEARNKVELWNNGECVDLTPIAGVKVSNQIGMGTLNITIPQAWLAYSDSNWIPPEQWDHGIGGALLDYNLVGNVRVVIPMAEAHHTISAAMAPLGLIREPGATVPITAIFCKNRATEIAIVSRGISFTPIARCLRFQPILRLGEMYFSSNLFDSYRFTGVSLANNDNMLPPSLRGYAPEIRGVAKSNATVTVTQNGRLIYETTVPAGPFAIQDMKNGVSGTLDVRVTEEDGTVTTFQTESANLPYLTRPGHVQYKLAAG